MASLQSHSALHSTPSSNPSDSTPASGSASVGSIPAGPASRHLIFDLGGDTCKIGWVGETNPRILSNSAVKSKRDTKWLVADQGLTFGTSATGGVTQPQGHDTSRNNKPPMSSAAVAAAAAASGKIMDYSGLYIRRAHDRGFVVNWDLENQVWSRCFHKSILDPRHLLSNSMTSQQIVEETSLLLTVPICTPSVLMKDLDENVFEKWGFAHFRRMNTSRMAHRGMIDEMYPSVSTVPSPSSVSSSVPTSASAPSVASSSPSIPSREGLHRLCALVVDSGFSFTHIMPVYQGRTIKSAVKRVNVGGKLLTNYLKELTSYRAWNMMDETYIMNDVKEKLCYVSTDFERELQAARKSRKVAEKIRREYVLPNGSTVLQGYVRTADSVVHPDDQVLLMGNERIAVPEVLFTPLDVGLQQGGLVENIVAAVEATPTWMHGLFYENIVLVGGNTKLPNYATRVEKELRPLVPTEYKIQCRVGKDPITTTWFGGSSLVADAIASQSTPLPSSSPSSSLSSLDYVTKSDFAEYGSEGLTRRWEGDDDEEEGEGDQMDTA